LGSFEVILSTAHFPYGSWWSKRDHQSHSRKLCIASLFSSFNSTAHTQTRLMVGRAVPNGSPWIYCVGKCSAEWPTSHTQSQRYGIKCHVIFCSWSFSLSTESTLALKHAHSRLMVGRAVPNGSHLDVFLVSAVPNGQLLTLKLKGMY